MKIRAYFYYIASNDVETQRKGMVFIGWAEGDFTSTPMPLSTESRRLYRCMLRGMPVRRTAVHFCVPDTLYFRLLSSFFVTVIVPSGGSNSLVRSRLHVGTFIFVQRYHLFHVWCTEVHNSSFWISFLILNSSILSWGYWAAVPSPELWDPSRNNPNYWNWQYKTIISISMDQGSENHRIETKVQGRARQFNNLVAQQ